MDINCIKYPKKNKRIFKFYTIFNFILLSGSILFVLFVQRNINIFIIEMIFLFLLMFISSIMILYFLLTKYRINGENLFIKKFFQKEKQIYIMDLNNIQEFIFNNNSYYRLFFNSKNIFIGNLNYELKNVLNYIFENNLKKIESKCFENYDKNKLLVQFSLKRKLIMTFMILFTFIGTSQILFLDINIIKKCIIVFLLIALVIIFFKHLYDDYFNCDSFYLSNNGIEIINKNIFLNWSIISEIYFKNDLFLSNLIILVTNNGKEIKIRKAIFNGFLIKQNYLFSKIKLNNNNA
jgi:hypothetical protein